MADGNTPQVAPQVAPQQGDPAGVQTPQVAPQGIDYEKLASLVAGKQSVTEEKVINGYFKQQGLSDTEKTEAIELYKSYKKAQEPNIDDLQKQISSKDSELAKAIEARVMAETKVEAMTMASELGVDQKTIPYLLKMADISSAIKDGQIDRDTLKENLNAVLNDLPALKLAPEEKVNGFKVGADTSGQQNTDTVNAELARIFGVQKK